MTRRLVSLIAVLALVASSCGGDESVSAAGVASLDLESPNTNSATSEPDAEELSATDEEQVLAFAQCLRNEGLDVDDPTVDAEGNVDVRSMFRSLGGGQGGPPEGFEEAFDACGDLVEGLSLGRGAGIDETELEDTLLEYAQCMRDNGFDMPDPDLSGGSGPGIFGQIDTDAPAFEAAQDACEDVLAGIGAPGGGGRATGEGANNG